jgi:hypothetical protein
MLVVTIEVKTEYSDILCGCVATVCCRRKCYHPRSFVCASCAFTRQMCPNNLEAVTLMFASLSVLVLIPQRINALKRRVVGVGQEVTVRMMLAQTPTHALQCTIIISGEEVAVVHICCTSLHIGACACLLAECDQVIAECHILFRFRSFVLNIWIPHVQPC